MQPHRIRYPPTKVMTMSPPSPEPDRPTGPDIASELRQDRYVGGRDLTRWSSRPGHWLAECAHRASNLLGPYQTLVLILVIGAVIAATMTWLASETYEAVTEANGVAVLDRPVLETMMDLRSAEGDVLATAYTNIAGTIGMPVLAATIMVFLAVRRRSWTPVILISAAAAGSLAMTVAGKDLIGRTRPPLTDAVPPFEHSPSFPSGHTLNALVIAGVVAYLILLRQHSRRTRILTVTIGIVFALTIGVSRVFLGHHWFTDVLAAWLLGLAWLATVITAHRLYLTTLNRSPGAPTTDRPEQ
jgi:membrane-associated phospholipid phosphatase